MSVLLFLHPPLLLIPALSSRLGQSHRPRQGQCLPMAAWAWWWEGPGLKQNLRAKGNTWLDSSCFGEEGKGGDSLAHAVSEVGRAGGSPAHKSATLLPCPCNPQAQK